MIFFLHYLNVVPIELFAIRPTPHSSHYLSCFPNGSHTLAELMCEFQCKPYYNETRTWEQLGSKKGDFSCKFPDYCHDKHTCGLEIIKKHEMDKN